MQLAVQYTFMARRLSPNIVVPGPWKDFLEGRAKQNGRSLSNEVRDTIQRAYKLADHGGTGEGVDCP